MTENIKKFLELVSANHELAQKMSTLSKEELIVEAKVLGIELTEDDFASSTELSDDELDTIAGGKWCGCCMGGGGEASGLSKTCACVLGSGGELNSGACRCVCAFYGEGYDCVITEES